MTDIPGLIERLRHQAQRYEVIPPVASRDMFEAADALSRLSEDKKRLEEALAPFVGLADELERDCCIRPRSGTVGLLYVKWDDLNAARSALKGEGT
jgi:hypothetical protein